jgi:hypothetical protein
LFTGRWEAVVAELSRTIDLEATARQFKAIQRVKKVRTAADLLRLAMIWALGGSLTGRPRRLRRTARSWR